MSLLHEKLSDISGSYLYRAVSLKALMGTLKDKYIEKESSWTRKYNYDQVAMMEEPAIAKIQTIKERCKAVGVNFTPTGNGGDVSVGGNVYENPYQKNSLKYEAEELNNKQLPLWVSSSVPLVSISLYDVLMKNPNYPSVNRLGNDRWVYANNFDTKNKKYQSVSSMGRDLTKAYQELTNYCKEYEFLFVKNETYKWFVREGWRTDFLSNDSSFNDVNYKMWKKILKIVNTFYYNEDSPSFASNRKRLQWTLDFINDKNQELTSGNLKWLYKTNPYFKYIILDSKQADVIQFLSKGNVNPEAVPNSQYNELLAIVSRKLQYMPGLPKYNDNEDDTDEEDSAIINFTQEIQYDTKGSLDSLKGLLLQSKKFNSWLEQSTNKKLSKLAQMLKTDDNVKARVYPEFKPKEKKFVAQTFITSALEYMFDHYEKEPFNEIAKDIITHTIKELGLNKTLKDILDYELEDYIANRLETDNIVDYLQNVYEQENA